MSKVGRKKEDEMIAARQFEVNECKAITTGMERTISWYQYPSKKVKQSSNA